MHIHGHDTGTIQLLAARLQDCDVHLRWGDLQVAGAINGECHLLDGLEQLQKLYASNIPCPTMVTNDPSQLEGMWLARKRNHTQGRDILTVGQYTRGRRRWQNSDFFVKYIPAVREWRFHILNGESIARGLKQRPTIVDMDVIPPLAERHPIIRSRRLGWHLRHDIDPPKTLRTLAKQAVAAVGYDLAAVDVLELADGTGIVLECNSRPAIRDNYTLDRYERAFRSL